MSGARVLLLGAKAEALAARLEASGYGVVCGAADAGAIPAVDVAVLAAEAADRIQELRQALATTPILLDVDRGHGGSPHAAASAPAPTTSGCRSWAPATC
jgi:hypothetical protein